MLSLSRWAPCLRLVGLFCLLAATAAPRLHAAAPASSPLTSAAPACLNGDVLWANSSTRSVAFDISGSGGTIDGGVRSNADLRLSGSNLTISGPLTYATSFEDGGDANSYPVPVRVAATAPPVRYNIADFKPGGKFAELAAAAGRYTVVNGDLDISEPRELNGLFYVRGKAKLGASDLRGAVTIVAEGEVEVSGSLQQLTPYADGLLLFSNKAEPGGAVLKLSGGSSDLRGVIYAPGGMVELSGSATRVTGLIFGDTLKLGGSDLRISFDGAYCPGQPTVPPSAAYAPNEVVVKLFDANELGAVARANGLAENALDQFGTRPIFRLLITDGTDPALKAEQLRPASGSGGDPRVQYAEPNFYVQDPEGRGSRGSWVIGGEDATTYATQWAPATIRLATAQQRSLGAEVTVAVLDTGVDRQHPALRTRLTSGYDFVNMDDDPSEVGVRGINAAYGHGTHVAGLVALAAPGALIMPVRVLDPNGVGNIWVLSEALIYTVERGPDGVPFNGDEPQVVNLSLGTLRETRLLAEVVADATCDDDDDEEDDDDDRCLRTGGVVVVAAAGNGGDATPQYPAAENVAGTLAVGASNQADTRADFSSFGPWVQLAAPGAGIVSTVPGGAYGVWSGSSMAAPLTAGVAALLRSADPELSAVETAQRIVDTARPIAGAIPLRLDAAAALGYPLPPTASAGRDFVAFLPMVRGGSPRVFGPIDDD